MVGRSDRWIFVVKIRRPSDAVDCTTVWYGVGFVVLAGCVPLGDDALGAAPVSSSEGTPSSEGGGSDMSESLSRDTVCWVLRSVRLWVSSVERAIAFWRRAVSASADLEYFSFCCAFLFPLFPRGLLLVGIH